MHSTQNWFGISKRRPRRDWVCVAGGGGKGGREARMDREKLRVRRGTQTVRKEDTGKEVETQRKRKARETKKTENIINKI